MNFDNSELNKGIYVPDLLLSRGILKPMEALLYCRCLRWFQNCKEKGTDFYLDHVEAAQFFQVSRRSIITYTQALIDAGLFIEIGMTTKKQKIYIVKDWRFMLDEVLCSEEDYEETKNKYQAERERNREQLEKHYEEKAGECHLQEQQPVIIDISSPVAPVIMPESVEEDEKTVCYDTMKEALDFILESDKEQFFKAHAALRSDGYFVLNGITYTYRKEKE